jgi:hypothetical protein
MPRARHVSKPTASRARAGGTPTGLQAGRLRSGSRGRDAHARKGGPEPLRKRDLIALPDFLDVA